MGEVPQIEDDVYTMGIAEGYTTGQMFPWLDPYERVEAATVKKHWQDYQKQYEEGWLLGFKLALKMHYAENPKFLQPH